MVDPDAELPRARSKASGRGGRQPPPLPWGGGCQCGAVRYRVVAWPLTVYCCHCLECQRQSASAFGMSMRLAVEGLDIDWSRLAVSVRDPGLPTEVNGHFCRACGVRIFHHRPGRGTLNLKPGTLDDASWLAPVGHLWTDRAQAGTRIDPALLAYPRQPPSYDPLVTAFRAAFPEPA